ncbi:MAG: hypothetical protein IJE68_00190 [Clostridia bacterium]|nr:hypothetical protein [Clostridia bacterium]
MRKRLNHKIKYSEKDYVKKNYMRNGKAVIPIKIKKLDELYMKHDYLKLDLSDEVSDYIEEIAYIIPNTVDIVLEIHYNDEISENQQQRIKKVFKSNYGSDIDDIDYKARIHNYKAIILLLFGAFFIFMSFIFNNLVFKLAGFIAEFFMISGWVFIWDMIETLSIKRTELISKRINKLQLYDAEITFIFDEL